MDLIIWEEIYKFMCKNIFKHKVNEYYIIWWKILGLPANHLDDPKVFLDFDLSHGVISMDFDLYESLNVKSIVINSFNYCSTVNSIHLYSLH